MESLEGDKSHRRRAVRGRGIEGSRRSGHYTGSVSGTGDEQDNQDDSSSTANKRKKGELSDDDFADLDY